MTLTSGLTALTVFAAALGGCSSTEVCEATCDLDCDGLVDETCSISLMVSAEVGGQMQIDDGPLAGFSLDIPPGALAVDTEVSMEIRHGLDLQEEPWTFAPASVSVTAADGDTMLYMDTWRTLNEVLANWGRYQHYDLLFIMEHFRQNGLGSSDLSFHFEPSGLEFDETVRLRLPYSETSPGAKELWPALRIGQWSLLEPSARLLENTEVDPVAKTISGDMNHFSDYQIKSGIADALANLGGTMPSVTSILVKLAGLGLVNAFDDSGTTVVPADIKRHAQSLANELLCGASQADFEVPSGAKWNELMAVLSTMPSLFADYPGANQFQTGFEDSLADSIRNQPGQVSFAKEFDLSMQLNNGKVFDSLMTMHNLGRAGYNLTSHYEAMTNIHPGITDLEGAHYHMAGVALLAMFNDSDAQSFAFSLGDEAIMSGLLKQSFEPGELVANLIGSQLMGEIANWDESSCVPATGLLSACQSGQGLAEEELVIKGDCGRSWHLTTDESGSVALPTVPLDCSSLWLEATIDGEVYSSDPISVPTDATSVDLGELVVPLIPTVVEGFVFDDQIPPQPVEGAIAFHDGAETIVDANGVFSFDERWISCDPFTVSASLGTTEGTSFETEALVGNSSVGTITLSVGEVLVSALSGTETGEDGTVVNMSVVLRSDPGDQTITVDVLSLDLTEGTVGPVQLTFGPGTWDVPQSVLVVGEPDEIFDGPVSYQVELSVSDPVDYTQPTFVNLVNLDGPLPIVSFDIDTVSRGYPSTGARIVEGTYVDNDLASGSITENESGALSEPWVSTVTGNGWSVDLVSSHSFSKNRSTSHTGAASPPYTLSETRSDTGTLTIAVEINGGVYYTLPAFVDDSSSSRSASTPSEGSEYTVGESTSTSTGYRVTRIRGWQENDVQMIRVYVVKTEVSSTTGLIEGGYEVSTNTERTTTTYELLLTGSTNGGPSESTENVVSTVTNSTATMYASWAFFMLYRGSSSDGLNGTSADESVNVTYETSLGHGGYAP